MSQGSVAGARFDRWSTALFEHGYEVAQRMDIPPAMGGVILRAERGAHLVPPAVTIELTELWLPGADPDGLPLEEGECYLEKANWQALIDRGQPNGRGDERVDVSRWKPAGEMIHRHPFGDQRRPHPLRASAGD